MILHLLVFKDFLKFKAFNSHQVFLKVCMSVLLSYHLMILKGKSAVCRYVALSVS